MFSPVFRHAKCFVSIARPCPQCRFAIDHPGGLRLGTTAAAKRLVAIVGVLGPTATDFANPPALQGDSKNSATTVKQAS